MLPKGSRPYVEVVVAAFHSHADPERAVAMKAYMRDQFEYCGIPAPARAALTREAWAGLEKPDEGAVIQAARALWILPEREFQYAAVALIRRHLRRLGPGLMPAAEAFIVTKSWWDTVDELAAHVVGPLALRYPELRDELDRYIESDNLWLARTAIIHQLGYKDRTDTERLFAYCERRRSDADFFIRKAIGWALREYSKTDPQAVLGFVAEHGNMSGLSRKEALRRVRV